MQETITTGWVVRPSHAPRPVRHCPSCRSPRPFRSSDKIRLNANGKLFDAWLIYKCSVCDQTWNRPIAERVTRASLGEEAFDALSRSDPAVARRYAFDREALRRFCHVLEAAAEDEVQLCKSARPDLPAWERVLLQIAVEAPTGLRFDRFLAQSLALSRGRLAALVQAGTLSPEVRGALRKPLVAEQRVLIERRGLSGEMAQHLERYLFRPPGDGYG
ncbi:MAG: DUF1062 domain-containing protein [Pseudomonadota bacterium]